MAFCRSGPKLVFAFVPIARSVLEFVWESGASQLFLYAGFGCIPVSGERPEEDLVVCQGDEECG